MKIVRDGNGAALLPLRTSTVTGWGPSSYHRIRASQKPSWTISHTEGEVLYDSTRNMPVTQLCPGTVASYNRGLSPVFVPLVDRVECWMSRR